VNLFF